jgi:hypothetical protein
MRYGVCQDTREAADSDAGDHGKRGERSDSVDAQPSRTTLGEWKMVEQQIGVLSHGLERIADAMPDAAAYSRFPGSGRSSPLPSSRQLPMEPLSARAVNSPPGLGLFPGNSPPEAGPVRWASASVATHICIRSWSMAPAPLFSASSETKCLSELGWMSLSEGLIATCSSLHLLTSWQELPGPCCPVVNHTDRALLLRYQADGATTHGSQQDRQSRSAEE